MKCGVTLIRDERIRQIVEERYYNDHDDAHANGEMAQAAACYAAPRPHADPRIVVPLGWPWGGEDWKPRENSLPETRVRQLVKAGALIAAEIDRIQRAHPELLGGAARR